MNKNFTIRKHTVNQSAKPAAPNPINHIAVIDVSGSMSSDLPKIRNALKNKVLNLVKEKDSLSIVWFSGKEQTGTLLEAFNLGTLNDLKTIHSTIDRWLQPQGLTGFVDPLNEVQALVKRVTVLRPNTDFAMFFMTDGQDNCCAPLDILKAAKAAGAVVTATTYVEYGWGCNRGLLAKMAEQAGGELIFSDGFDDYEANLSKTIQFGKTLGSKKVSVPLSTKIRKDFAFAVSDGSILTFAIESDPKTPQVTVPANLNEFFTIDEFDDQGGSLEADVEDKLVALYVLAQRMTDTDLIFEILEDIGDVRLHRIFSNCFSKQDYIRFQEAVYLAIFDEEERFEEGMSDNLKIDPNAFCVLDLLDLLSSDPENKVYPKHPDFFYKKTTASTVQKDTIITDEELADLQAQLATAVPADLTRIMEEIKELQATKNALKFEFNDQNKGYPLNGIVWNEDRPNVSVRFLYDGFIRLPESRPAGLPALINTHIFRNYTIVLDGIVHMSRLPVSLTAKTYLELQMNGFFPNQPYLGETNVYVLDFTHLPVINRNMVTEISGDNLCRLSWELENLKGSAKVFKELYKAQGFEKPQLGLLSKYDEEAVAWLKTVGITDGGFSPPRVKGEDVDQYNAKVCEVAVASLSSLAKLSEVVDKYKATEKDSEAGIVSSVKWLLKEQVMLPAYKAWLDCDFPEVATPEVEAWLNTAKTNLIKQTRDLQVQLARIKFALIVGHVWFKDISFDDPTLELDLGMGKPVKFTVKLMDKTIGKVD